MSSSRLTWLRFGQNAAGALVLSAFAVAIAIEIPLVSTKVALFAVAGALVALAVVVSGRPKEIFLAGYILALTYNRQFFSFDDVLGNNGSQGLYWVPADLLLVMLLGAWLFDGARRTAPPMPNDARIAEIAWPALMFLSPCIVSALLAERPDWAFNELMRVLRFVLVLVWLQYNMTRSLWYTAVASFAVAVLVQGGFGTAQVVLHADRNLLSVFGASGQEILNSSGEVDVLDNRARGTLGHPNFLAPYLLTLLPACLGVAFYSRFRLLRLVAIGVLLVGVAGIIATKSRGPIALCGLSLLAMCIQALRDRRLSLASVCGGAVLTTVLLTGVAIPYAAQISERIWGDFNASVTFRTEYNEAALAIWNDAPIFGIGLNNLTLGLEAHSPLFHWLAVELEQFRGDADVRAIAPVHNLYLLVLAETGLMGLIGFMILLSNLLWRSVKAARISHDAVRGICAGLAIGISAQYIQQMIDFSLWGDPGFYTLAVLMALVGSVATLRPTLP